VISAGQWLGQNSDHLLPIEPPHKLEAQTCEQFLHMQHAARQAGVSISIASSHRDFSRQLAIWNQKWQGLKPLYSPKGTVLKVDTLSDEQKLHAILTWSALPGASRHHWGTDLDIYDPQAMQRCGQTLQLVSEEYAPGGPCHQLALWLNDNAQNYGFYQPYAQYNGGVAAEPWHISYRPLALKIEQQLQLGPLQLAIELADINGKSCILDNLEMIFLRYTLNKGTL
jgi:LAS superfamily LD-carboxypeptidase LdcB